MSANLSWIRIDRGIPDDAKTNALADRLNLPLNQAVGIFTCLFIAMAKEAQDGRIGHVSPATLERWARWEGKRGALGPVLLELLTDRDGVVPSWEKYNGSSIQKAEKDAARKRAERASRPGSSAGRPADSPPDIREPSGVDGTVTGRDGDGRAIAPDGDLLATPRAGAGEAPPVPSAARPPRTATATPELPPAAKELVARAYRSATPQRIADVQAQLLDTLSVRGARLDRRTQVHAVDAEHLNRACSTAIGQLSQLRDVDKAGVLVLKILHETWPAANAAHEKAQLTAGERSRSRSSASPIAALIPDQIRRPA